MSDDFKIIDTGTGPGIEEPPESKPNAQNGDNSGFGLVNWLFDHIKDRKPVFMSLYQQYDQEVKLSSRHRVISPVLLTLSTFFDLVVFMVYAAAVILVIVGITFIFVKGTGLLDYVHNQDPASQHLSGISSGRN